MGNVNHQQLQLHASSTAARGSRNARTPSTEWRWIHDPRPTASYPIGTSVIRGQGARRDSRVQEPALGPFLSCSFPTCHRRVLNFSKPRTFANLPMSTLGRLPSCCSGVLTCWSMTARTHPAHRGHHAAWRATRACDVLGSRRRQLFIWSDVCDRLEGPRAESMAAVQRSSSAGPGVGTRRRGVCRCGGSRPGQGGRAQGVWIGLSNAEPGVLSTSQPVIWNMAARPNLAHLGRCRNPPASPNYGYIVLVLSLSLARPERTRQQGLAAAGQASQASQEKREGDLEVLAWACAPTHPLKHSRQIRNTASTTSPPPCSLLAIGAFSLWFLSLCFSLPTKHRLSCC